jgi:3-oxoacyl-[acyl-carrier-protein] synthase-3
MQKITAAITAVGGYVPETVLTNKDLEQFLDTTDEWIRDRTGIHERRVIGKGESTSTLALMACQKAMQAAQVDPAEIDLFVLGNVRMHWVMSECVAHRVRYVSFS